MRRWLPMAAVVLLVAASVFPLYWALVSSITPESRLFEAPALVPSRVTLDHYRALFAQRDFITPIKNSLVVAASTTALCVAVGSLCAYALARLEFRGKTPLLAFVLAVSMFPQITVVSPLYLVLRELGLIDTYPGLVFPYVTFAMPLTADTAPFPTYECHEGNYGLRNILSAARAEERAAEEAAGSPTALTVPRPEAPANGPEQ